MAEDNSYLFIRESVACIELELVEIPLGEPGRRTSSAPHILTKFECKRDTRTFCDSESIMRGSVSSN
jgi:hypothetical protein